MDTLQYITHDHANWSHAELAEAACKAGVKWIQLRMKNATDEEFISEGEKIYQTCKQHGATFILNDKVHLVERLNADGVHLGLTDMSTAEARKVLGSNRIIGGTANTLQDLSMHYNNGVNYVGVGPFQTTVTKKNLSPVLGANGYKNILSQMEAKGIKLPVIAIGGIEQKDFRTLLEIGVNSIAVSGLITKGIENAQAEQVVSAYHQLKQINDG